MGPFARYAASFAVLVPGLILPARFVLDPLVHPDPLALEMIEAFDHAPVDVLFFGDSVITTSSVCDTGDVLIPDALATLLDRPVLTIAHWAYSPLVFQDYAKLLRRTVYKPALVVLPINIRTFSDQFFRNPDFHFGERRLRIRRAALGLDLRQLPSFVADWLRDEIAKLAFDWVPVTIDGVELGTNAEIERKSRIDVALECLHEPYDYEEELSLRFTYHYMGVVPEDHPLFADLAATIEELRSQGIAVLAYLTPVNVEEGVGYVGPALSERVRRNADLVVRTLARLGVPSVDLVEAVPAADFIDKSYACEHLNQRGRNQVAEALARRIERDGLLPDAAGSAGGRP
jgi:hypothetical protein